MKMNAIQYWGIDDIRYEQIEIKEPKSGEVLVKVEAALTCGTDLKTLRRGHPVLIKSIPSGFGHEFSGIVAQVGANVKDFSVGDLPGGPVVKTLSFHCKGHAFDPWSGN